LGGSDYCNELIITLLLDVFYGAIVLLKLVRCLWVISCVLVGACIYFVQPNGDEGKLFSISTLRAENADQVSNSVNNKYSNTEGTELFLPEVEGATFFVLDKIASEVWKLNVQEGTGERAADLIVDLLQCHSFNDEKYHIEDYALMKVWEADQYARKQLVFYGWMFSKQRSVSSMEHAEYDVWLEECTSG